MRRGDVTNQGGGMTQRSRRSQSAQRNFSRRKGRLFYTRMGSAELRPTSFGAFIWVTDSDGECLIWSDAKKHGYYFSVDGGDPGWSEGFYPFTEGDSDGSGTGEREAASFTGADGREICDGVAQAT